MHPFGRLRSAAPRWSLLRSSGTSTTLRKQEPTNAEGGICGDADVAGAQIGQTTGTGNQSGSVVRLSELLDVDQAVVRRGCFFPFLVLLHEGRQLPPSSNLFLRLVTAGI